MIKKNRNKIVVINNKIENIQTVRENLEALAEEWEIPADVTFNMDLALEEIITNTIQHGYDKDGKYPITIRYTLDGSRFRVQVKDEAPAFNPLDAPEPDDIDKAIQDRKVGGLGIHLVKKLIDSVAYRHHNDKNIITLIQNID